MLVRHMGEQSNKILITITCSTVSYRDSFYVVNCHNNIIALVILVETFLKKLRFEPTAAGWEAATPPSAQCMLKSSQEKEFFSS